MNIRKNKSGNWEIRIMIDGKTYSKSVKGKKPTEREAYEIILAVSKEGEKPSSISFCDASKEYIASRINIISPTTYREYGRICDRLPDWFTCKDIYEITQIDMQNLTNELSLDKSSKTVHNYHGFCVSVIGFYRPDVTFNTTFKQSDKKDPYIPTKDEVDRIIKESEGTEYHIPLQLARYSLRRSELCALRKSDLDDNNYIHVTKALVLNSNKEWVIKRPKTPDSYRIVPIDKELADEIRSLDREEIYPYYPQNIIKYLYRTQKKLNIPKFSLHKLRHFFASELHGIVPEADIQKIGGWKTNAVLRQNYTHSDISRDKETQRVILNRLK